MSSQVPGPEVESSARRYIAFAGERRIAAGLLPEVAQKVRRAWAKDPTTSILVFDEASSELKELPPEDDPAALEPCPAADQETQPRPRGPGRPRLGVVGREVTLLPRHWEWLDEQPGGASVALRKLVEFARRENRGRDAARRSQEAAHRFMLAMAGDRPGYEEATRAFYAGDKARFDHFTRTWPRDIRDHLDRLVEAAFRDAAAANGVARYDVAA